MERNKRIKEAPQRWQDAKEMFDVIITCEERCFGIVCEDLMERGSVYHRPVHVINFDITDSAEEAIVGARSILALAQQLVAAECLEEEIERIMGDVQEREAFKCCTAYIFIK